jgi:hypothetical protein
MIARESIEAGRFWFPCSNVRADGSIEPVNASRSLSEYQTIY